jgi:hypothetical protein
MLHHLSTPVGALPGVILCSRSTRSGSDKRRLRIGPLPDATRHGLSLAIAYSISYRSSMPSCAALPKNWTAVAEMLETGARCLPAGSRFDALGAHTSELSARKEWALATRPARFVAKNCLSRFPTWYSTYLVRHTDRRCGLMRRRPACHELKGNR